jgi:riboflavin kinase/FMN adenylyltransferase
MGDFRVAYSLDDVKRLAPRASALTLGVFDGVHRGHRSIIEELIRTGKNPGIESTFLITFSPHPVVVTRSRKAPRILTTIDERLDLFERFPLDGVFVVRFDEKMRNTDYRDFIRDYLLDAFDMRTLVLGYDCHFGRNREGGPESVQAEGRRHGFEVKVVPPLQINGQVVSSTFIRSTLIGGDLSLANEFLGHPFSVAGVVERGAGKGGQIGFPTANLRIDHPRKLWPQGGAYATRVKIDGQVHNGMMNVGTAPTLKGEKPTIEVHVFDFDADIYGKKIIAYCHARLRDEVAFSSPRELVEQLGRDRLAAMEILSRSEESARGEKGTASGT